MRQVLISDVTKRLRCLSMINRNQRSNKSFQESSKYSYQRIRSMRPSDAIHAIEAIGKKNEEANMGDVLSLFDAIVEYGTVSEIRKTGCYIVENVVPKTRDSKKLQTLLKGRMTRLQNKLNPTKFDIKDMQARAKAAEEAYKNIEEEAIIYHNCDRVLENYNRISKRFNLESIFINNTSKNGVFDTVVELCNIMDTYEMPNEIKFNTVIETAFYGFEYHSIPYKKSEILDAASNYFAFKENGINDCKSILDTTIFYDKDDIKDVDILMEDEPEEDTPQDVDESIRENYSYQVIKEQEEFSDIFKKFKEDELGNDETPNPSKLRNLVTKLYSRNVDSIVEDTPDLLRWFRSFFIIGSAVIPVIGPFLLIINYIADRFISLHVNIEETNKMLKCFNNEISASKSKLKTVSDPEEKERLEKYIKSLEDAKNKIEIYRMDLTDDLPEDDLDAESIAKDAEGSDFDNDFNFDDDFGFDDDDDFFGEIFNMMDSMSNQSHQSSINEGVMYYLPSKLNNNLIIDVANCIKYFPESFYAESFVEGLNAELNKTRRSRSLKTLERCYRTTAIESALDALKGIAYTAHLQSPMSEYTIANAYSDLSFMNEISTSIELANISDCSEEALLEASIKNRLNVASMKLRNAFTKMSDKEKALSKTVDVSMNNLTKSAEKALTTDNREAVIKGSILPSASKCIKLGIVNGGLVALGHPVIAIIGFLGYIATNKKFKAKERQMVIDELEIELEMCEKYLSIAESKNDMKATKQLLTTKKELERQIQRIKYKMRVDFGQKYYDSGKSAADSGY